MAGLHGEAEQDKENGLGDRRGCHKLSRDMSYGDILDLRITRVKRKNGQLASELEAFEDTGGAHATADAHGDHAVAGVAALQFAHERGGEFGSGAAERMAEGDGAAVGIDARGIQIGLLDDGEGLRGERFVQFDHGEIVERESREIKRFRNGVDRADAEFFWRSTRRWRKKRSGLAVSDPVAWLLRRS